MDVYRHPESLPRSRAFSLCINGEPVEVLHTDVADFAICALAPEDLPAIVEVTSFHPATAAEIHPVAKNIPASLDGGIVRFTLTQPEKLSIGISGSKPLYLFANPPETDPPAPGDPGVVTFAAGQLHEVPLLTLEEGHTLYLPGGAVLKGRIHIKGKSGLRICGHGIFDGSLFDRDAGERARSIIIDHCSNVMIEEITMVRPSSWLLVLAACAEVTVRNLKQIGEVMCSDGIDVVGSREVLIEDCFLHNNDDCVVIKANFVGYKNNAASRIDARQNVENVLVRRCTLSNWVCGNVMEIGHELSTECIRNITFTDIDVLQVHGQGAVFSLHNNDRALIENVLYEDIRIEHCYDKLIDFRISKSRYSSDAERGHIRGVILRNIQWTRTPYNFGYTVSLIGGWDAAHRIEDVLIDNFRMDGRPVEHLDELEICTRHCRNLRLQSPKLFTTNPS